MRYLLLFMLPALLMGGEPSWIKVAPTQPGRVYAAGCAAIASSEAAADELAANNARFEVLAKLQVDVKGSTTTQESYTEQTGKKPTFSQGLQENYTTSVTATELPGLVIADRWHDNKTAWALCYLDASLAETALTHQKGALMSDWDVLTSESLQPGFRGALTRMKATKVLRVRATILEDKARILILAGVNPNLRKDLHRMGQLMDLEISRLQKQITIGGTTSTDGLSQDTLGYIRTEMIHRGFTWTDKNPAVTIVIEARGSIKQVSNIFEGRAHVKVTLVDTGAKQEGFDMQIHGAGLNAIVAENSLRRDLYKNLEMKLADFFNLD